MQQQGHHARPHLHTHNRGKRHSPVAGAAYRLGLDLFDERTQTLHRYSKRAGKEVVHAETIGPPGVPASVLDPAVLWNAVDREEKHSHAQLARDFRIPIPLGLGVDDAIAMSKAMAGFIVARFNTAVSIGVHRDNAVDLDGNTKDASKVGFHAHLYFPTRELQKDGEGSSAFWFLGRKITELSNKNTSGPALDALNDKWAALANRYAAKAGLETRYESKSYKRLGLDTVPKTERARRFGKPNDWYRPSPGKSPDEGLTLVPGLRRKRKEAAWAARQAGVASTLELGREALGERLAARRGAVGTRLATQDVSRAKRRADRGFHGKTPVLNRVSLVGGRTLRIDHHLRLAEAMRSAGPPPKTDADVAALERAMFLADLIESLLFGVERGRQRAADFALELRRQQVALDDALARQGILDRELRLAEEKLAQWLVRHPLRARFRVASNEHAVLVSSRDLAAKHSQRLQASVEAKAKKLSDLTQRKEADARRDAEMRTRIIDNMQAYKPDFRFVADALRTQLTQVQNADVAEAADRLGIDAVGDVSAARAEAPFASSRKSNP